MLLQILAVFLAAASSMVVGAVWFAPRVFGTRWQTLTQVDPNRTPVNPLATYGGAFAWGLVTAASISAAGWNVHQANGGSALVVTLVCSGAAWLGFTVAPTGVHYLFEGRPARLLAINMFHQLTAMLVMALIIGLFGF